MTNRSCCSPLQRWSRKKTSRTHMGSRSPVLCHHSPRWISRTFEQDPIYSDGNPFLYMCYNPLWTMLIVTPILVTPPIHFASSWYLPPSELSYLQATSSAHLQQAHLSCLCIKKPSLMPWSLSFWRQAMECGGKQDNGDSKWRQGATLRQ